jgi:ABC-type oligopeptide transport system substrate-binding subunit
MSQFFELGFVFGNEVGQGVQESVKGVGVAAADDFTVRIHFHNTQLFISTHSSISPIKNLFSNRDIVKIA